MRAGKRLANQNPLSLALCNKSHAQPRIWLFAERDSPCTLDPETDAVCSRGLGPGICFHIPSTYHSARHSQYTQGMMIKQSSNEAHVSGVARLQAPGPKLERCVLVNNSLFAPQ